jgi:hypothetical protein
MPIQKYDIPDPLTGERLVRYWSLIAVPVHGPAGEVAFVVQRTEDITDFLLERGVSSDAPEDARLRRRVEEVEADLYARRRSCRWPSPRRRRAAGGDQPG